MGFVAGVLLVDLFEAFDFISNDLLVAKLHAYDISLNAVTFTFIYLTPKAKYKNSWHF